MNAAKTGIHFMANVVNAGTAAGQHLANRPPSRTKHAVGHNPQLRAGNDVQIHQCAEMLIISPGGVEFSHQPLLNRFL